MKAIAGAIVLSTGALVFAGFGADPSSNVAARAMVCGIIVGAIGLVGFVVGMMETKWLP